MAKVTIEHISEETGLSRGTVSRALNDRPDISARTKQRVLEACRKLNYVPSQAARALATGRNYAVTVLVEDLQSAFAVSFVRGVMTAAARQNYSVSVAEIAHDPLVLNARLYALGSERIDGVLTAVRFPASSAAALAAAVEGRPVASTCPLPGVAADVLAPDYVEAGRLAAQQILAAGSAALFVYAPECPHALDSYHGFEEICRARGIEPTTVSLARPAPAGGPPPTPDSLRDRLRRTSAVAATNDLLAVQLMLLSYEVGRVPGRDIAILGQGNDPCTAGLRPSLSTIDLGGEEIGLRAMETTLQRLNKSRLDSPQTTLVPPRLVRRESTASLA